VEEGKSYKAGRLHKLRYACVGEECKEDLTDSGGVQKEAYIFKVPCITLRDTTEWVETVEDGWNVLVGANDDVIIKMANGFEPEGE